VTLPLFLNHLLFSINGVPWVGEKEDENDEE
jgi:hypothetical protein